MGAHLLDDVLADVAEGHFALEADGRLGDLARRLELQLELGAAREAALDAHRRRAARRALRLERVLLQVFMDVLQPAGGLACRHLLAGGVVAEDGLEEDLRLNAGRWCAWVLRRLLRRHAALRERDDVVARLAEVELHLQAHSVLAAGQAAGA